ncbi:MAG: cytochrome-c oxidase, cbb3-type subunit III [Alphaproteobacteria bacterium]|nr:cytochrome-c oxidase, cbb3-type subunit III [Alphaproteobacteria bacterium]
MAVEERDPYSGWMTTGHEWNGIKELNTPVPRAVWFFLGLAALFSLGYWILMPAWPLGRDYTRGLLGLDQREIVAKSIAEAAADRPWLGEIANKDFPVILADPRLMADIRQTGRTLFGDNCAACHGQTAQGGPGFPNLTAGSWLWGGDPADIAETIRVGINSANPDSRTSQMMAFGRDEILPRTDVEAVAAYVRSLSNLRPAGTQAQIEAGKALFAANCTTCHGEDAKGNQQVGAPDLTDRYWIYGSDLQTVFATVWGGRQGHMPSWQGRLSPTDIKILALYLTDLRKRGS